MLYLYHPNRLHVDAELMAHAEAFCELLSSTVGLPPVGVTLFGQRNA